MATIRWCPIAPKWDIYQSLGCRRFFPEGCTYVADKGQRSCPRRSACPQWPTSAKFSAEFSVAEAGILTLNFLGSAVSGTGCCFDGFSAWATSRAWLGSDFAQAPWRQKRSGLVKKTWQIDLNCSPVARIIINFFNHDMFFFPIRQSNVSLSKTRWHRYFDSCNHCGLS